MNVSCEENSELREVAVERHDGTVDWQTVVSKITNLDTVTLTTLHGIVGVNCTGELAQDIWVDLDECGQGTITRRFFITGGCGSQAQAVELQQVIKIASACGMRGSMFDLPANIGSKDHPICLPQGLTDSFFPDTIGKLTLKPHLDGKLCNSFAFGSNIKSLDVAGTDNMKKYIIDWTVIDWCAPHTSSNREFVHRQEIIAIIDPACELDGGDDITDISLISGDILTELGSGINGVEISVQSGASSPVRLETSGNGAYQVSVAHGVSGSLVPYLNSGFSEGVSTADLIAIQRHILQKEKLDGKYKLIAADVNGNGIVEGTDVLELRKLVLNPSGRFANNTSWRFFEHATGEEVYEFSNLSDSRVVDFTGVKIGDVDYTSDPATANRSRNGELSLNVTDKLLKGGELYRIEVRSDNFASIRGMQYTLGYSDAHLRIESIEPGVLEVSENHYMHHSAGNVTFSWHDSDGVHVGADQVLFTVVVRAKLSGMLSDILSLSDRVISREAYTDGGDLRNVSLHFDGSARGFTLYQNTPNPFTGETVIGFELPESGEAVLTIYDVHGRLIRRVEGIYESGYHEVRLRSADLDMTGVLYYQLDTDRYTATKKMIVVK